MPENDEAPGRYADLTPCYWGSVNQWECDENDHLNVRFYAHKVNQAVALILSSSSDTKPDNVAATVRCQHIRFLAEARAATPLRIDCGVLDQGDDWMEIVSLMHDNVSGRILSAFRTTLVTAGRQPAPRPSKPLDLPVVAQPRGIDPSALPAPPAGREEARGAGYRIVGRGIVGAELCDAQGLLEPHAYIGLISDGMPNLWAFLNPAAEQSARAGGKLGGAALEQRLEILEPLTRGAVFVQLSGVRAIGNKTQQMAHVLYDETHGRVAAVAEAVGVAMDLASRKAVVMSPERRRHLEGLLLR